MALYYLSIYLLNTNNSYFVLVQASVFHQSVFVTVGQKEHKQIKQQSLTEFGAAVRDAFKCLLGLCKAGFIPATTDAKNT